MEMTAGNIYEGKGIWTLYERLDKNTGCCFDSLDSRFHFKMETRGLGRLNSIFANMNPWK